MRAFIPLCLMALVLSASTKSTPDNVHTVLSEMDKSKFGQSILSFLSLNTAAEVPVDEILQVLEEVSDQIQNRQADADAYNNTNQALCDEALNNLGNQLATEADTISTLENTINVEGSNRDNAKRELNQAATDYDETVNALDSGNAQREAEHEKWVNTDYEHEQGLVAIEETIKLIKHMLHGVTFAQIKSRYEKVQETLRGTSKFGTLFKPLILGLSELATKLNYESVVKILDLLNNIHAALTESRTNYRLTEEKAAADWDSLSSTLSDQKQALADQKTRLNGLITSTEEIIAQSESSLSFHTQNQIRLQESFDAQSAWCNNQSDYYVSETNERSRQSTILTKLTSHINDRFGAVTEFLQSRRLDF